MDQILLVGWLGTTVRVRLDPLFILLLLETVVNQKRQDPISYRWSTSFL
ncbi:hypothetical protein M595_5015 [Lyngbya aestuarii BL J]|uniref:Uncharacterized protein n=1 Tax=Lyngbya aestuarii BL J TaxID=1348334 RepID=U7QB33_9CYAN|nr:hypothetical protein M595_5015 [Lyngbya aestuarii BL J]